MSKKQNRGPARRHESVPLGVRMIQLPLMALILTLLVEFLNRGMDVNRLFAFVTGRPVH